MHTILRYRFSLGFLLIGLVFSLGAMSQNRVGTVKGTIVDTAAKKFLPSATINVLDAKDSTLVSFARSKENGSFEITRLAEGNYLLMVSYTGFAKVNKTFSITAAAPAVDFAIIPMASNATLEDVTVVAAPVTIKGDTVEFNAGSFKVNKPNAVVEDLLKRLPGVEVDKDGNIKANGQDVKRVLVDGKEFFSNDPKLATKNLQADMVNKVQVYERKSDQSQFTGFDDGNTEPTINLTLKNDKRNGIFGRASAGGGGDGTDARYLGNANINRFQKGEQLSFIGQANNTNQQGFSLMDALSFAGGGGGGGRGGTVTVTGAGGGGNQQGITATQAAGINYNNFKNSNLDLTSSYFFNGTQLRNDYLTRRETTVADSMQLYAEPGRTSRDNFNHRFNMGVDWKLDSNNSIKITPSFTWQNTESESSNVYQTAGPKGGILSNGFNRTTSESEGYNLNVSALYRHKFARKGRTFSTELRVGQNESDAQGSQVTVNNRLNGPGQKSDSLDQRNTTEASSNTVNITARYTEPMSRRSLLEFSVFHNMNNNIRDQRTYNYNKLTGEYDIVNTRLTNLIDNDYMTSGTGLKFRENRPGWNYTVGADLQRAELTSLLAGKNEPITQTFLNLLPNAQVQIGKNRYRNFRLFYNGTTQNPSVTQLQPIEDITDPLNIKRGNPDLKQSFTNSFRANYSVFDPYTMKSFFAFINARQTFNAIVNNDSMFTNGARLTTYENAEGVYNLSGNFNIGLPVNFGQTRANLNLGTMGSYNHNVNFINDEANDINTINITQRVSLNYTFKELFDVSVGGSGNWSDVKYSLQATQNTNYASYGADFETNWYIPKLFTIGTTVVYTANTGRAEGFNPNFTMWNAYLSKSFLKNKKGELRFSVYDILNQNTGVDRNANGNYVQDTRYTVLKRYAMLSFTYNLSKFGNIGGGGGGGMMRGMQRTMIM